VHDASRLPRWSHCARTSAVVGEVRNKIRHRAADSSTSSFHRRGRRVSSGSLLVTIGPESPIGETSVLRSMVRELAHVDRAVYTAIARQPTPSANYSRLWLGTSAALYLFAGRSGRRAARRGLTAVSITSLSVNVLAKSLYRRRRPVRDDESFADDRFVRMPTSPSFPSGHSASAFAFAVASSSAMPALVAPLRLVAASVAYSRVHTGVHYPGDVIAGALIGSGIGQVVGSLQRRSDDSL
jgi:membrane-associated phospholipid phosphatase